MLLGEHTNTHTPTIMPLRCLEACARVLLGERPPRMEGNWEMSKAGTVAMMNAMQVRCRQSKSTLIY